MRGYRQVKQVYGEAVADKMRRLDEYRRIKYGSTEGIKSFQLHWLARVLINESEEAVGTDVSRHSNPDNQDTRNAILADLVEMNNASK